MKQENYGFFFKFFLSGNELNKCSLWLLFCGQNKRFSIHVADFSNILASLENHRRKENESSALVLTETSFDDRFRYRSGPVPISDQWEQSDWWMEEDKGHQKRRYGDLPAMQSQTLTTFSITWRWKTLLELNFEAKRWEKNSQNGLLLRMPRSTSFWCVSTRSRSSDVSNSNFYGTVLIWLIKLCGGVQP